MFRMAYVKLMVGVVGRIQILFMEIAKVVLEGHQGRTKSVAGVNMALVPSATVS